MEDGEKINKYFKEKHKNDLKKMRLKYLQIKEKKELKKKEEAYESYEEPFIKKKKNNKYSEKKSKFIPIPVINIKSKAKSKKESNQIDKNQFNEEVKEILEDMCLLGSKMKKEIIEEKKNNPEAFISIKEATKEENKNQGIFCLGILAQNLEELGITTAIEKDPSNDEDEHIDSNTILEYIINGMITKKKYEFHFDLGEERNSELLNNEEEQEKFNNKLKKKLSKVYNISYDEIIITNPQKGSYKVQVIFASNKFNDINIDVNTLRDNCNEDEFKELKNLRKIHTCLIMDGCKLSPNMLDHRGNRIVGWGENELRGGFKYLTPKGWKGFGLKVWDKYDNGNNDWLAHDGNSNEWAIAYHGIGVGKNCKTPEESTHKINEGGFKPGNGQAYQSSKNINTRYIPKDEENDHSKLVGAGVYCSPDPEVMNTYAKNLNTKINGKKYKIGFMMRVKPDKIRIAQNRPDYWVLDGTKEEMRPYRIMLKEN